MAPYRGIEPRSMLVNSQTHTRLVRKKMARLERFELPTPWFVARCSIQMSYRRMKMKNGTQSEIRTRVRFPCRICSPMPSTAWLPVHVKHWCPRSDVNRQRRFLRPAGRPLRHRGKTFSKTTNEWVAYDNALVGMKGIEPLPVG
jgi:hypothetical protein